MKKMLLALSLALIGPAAVAAPLAVTVVEISATGTGHPFGNDPALIDDGVIPAEGSAWDGDASAYWKGNGKSITLSFDDTYEIHDLILSVDGNDSYLVEVSLDKISWFDLILVPWYRGEQARGMETISTGAGEQEYAGELDFWLFSVAAVDFEPMLARHARISAVAGDNRYAVGELAFFGIPMSAKPAAGAPDESGNGSGPAINLVPEPGSLALLATALLGAGLSLRRRRS